MATQSYNNPHGTPSTIGDQVHVEILERQALTDALRHSHFSPLADHKTMPPHMGKSLKVFKYEPLLDDRNTSSQGIDANGVTIANGNLYGSSKDIGNISSKMPTLTEHGGRVNGVGFTRNVVTGTHQTYGFFFEYTEDALTYDNDPALLQHNIKEMMNGGVKIYEDLLQMDLLSNAGVKVYTGAATQMSEITGEGVDPSIVSYDDLDRLRLTLNANRTPMQTTMITGTQMTDTKTVQDGRYIYIGPELERHIRSMEDSRGELAFIPCEKYAAGTNQKRYGEIGSVAGFRFVVVQEMQYWSGAGAAEVTPSGYRTDGTNYDVFPMLFVGDESFATVGLQGKGQKKFQTTRRKPGDTPTLDDPYTVKGLEAIRFDYGFIALRPERIAVVYTVAPN